MVGKRLMQYQRFHCVLYRTIYDRFRLLVLRLRSQTVGWCTMMFCKNAFCLRLLKLCGRGNITVVMPWSTTLGREVICWLTIQIMDLPLFFTLVEFNCQKFKEEVKNYFLSCWFWIKDEFWRIHAALFLYTSSLLTLITLSWKELRNSHELLLLLWFITKFLGRFIFFITDYLRSLMR
jgi:hypothetical protein